MESLRRRSRVIVLAAACFAVVSLPAVSMGGTQPDVAEHAVEREYTWYTAGSPSGRQTVKATSGGRSVSFKFNDRGGGPELTTRMELDANGLLTSYVTVGVDYTKAPVEEKFRIQGGLATWSSALERGSAQVRVDRLYFPVEQTPEYRAVLARVLLAQPGRKIELLPDAGTARIEQADSMLLAVAGKLRAASLYEITGIDTAPNYIWLDEDREMIGYGEDWFAVLRSDWTAHLSVLLQAQENALSRRVRLESEKFRKHSKRPMVIANVRIFEPGRGRLGEISTVVIRDGVIAEIVPGATPPSVDLSVDLSVDSSADVDRIDGGGKTLMAALWDMHGHISPSTYLNYIASGVLSVRDMGNDPVYLEKLRRGIESRSIDAPDVYPMGFIDKRGPYAAPTGRLVDTLEEARAAVATYARERYAGIKLYSSIEPGWIPVLAGDADSLGLRTVGHIPPHISPAQAIRSGYREITHINMLLLELIGDLTVDTRTPQRFIVPGERGGSIDVASSQAQAFMDLMLKHKVAHDPTLATFLSQYRSRSGEVAFRAVPYADHLPASLRRAQVRSASYNHQKEDAFERTGEVALKLIKRLHEKGIQILPGTDASLPGFALVSELECYALAGIPNEEVLGLATIGTARYIGQEHALGSVEVGKKAYLMLIDGDPVKSLSALRKVELVVKGDTSFDAKEILRAQGIRPF